MEVRLDDVYRKTLDLGSFDYRAVNDELANCVKLVSNEGADLAKLLANKNLVIELLNRIQERFNQLRIESTNFELLEKRITEFYETGA